MFLPVHSLVAIICYQMVGVALMHAQVIPCSGLGAVSMFHSDRGYTLQET